MIKKATNITFKVDEDVLAKAREKALVEHQSLNSLVNQWMKNYTYKKENQTSYLEFMKQFDGIKIGKKFTREEMNER